MHKLYDLKEMLCRELEEYGQKGEVSAGDLNAVDTLAHAIKNIDKIIEAYEEEEYSNRGGSYENGESYRGGSYRNYSREGRSYARGRGRNAKRDSRGRYSSEGYSRSDNMIDQLYDLMEDAPDEKTRQEMQRMIQKMESNM